MKEIVNKNYKEKKVSMSLFTVFTICGLVFSGTSLNVHALSNYNDVKTYSTIKSYVKLDDQLYLIKYNLCAVKTVESPTILVKTDKVTMKILYQETIFSGMCKSFETIVPAKYPSKITIDAIETNA